jgi:hypothetical protein
MVYLLTAVLFQEKRNAHDRSGSEDEVVSDGAG